MKPPMDADERRWKRAIDHCTVPSGHYTSLSTGSASCAIDTDGYLVCWGCETDDPAVEYFGECHVP